MGNIWQINFSCLSLSHFVNAKLKSSRQALSSRTKLLWANSRARSDFQPKFSSLKLRTKPLRMGGCNVTQPGCILSIYSGPNLLGKVWNWSTHWPDTFTERGGWGKQRQKYFRRTRISRVALVMNSAMFIPDICQFWGTTTLFRPVKGALRVHKFVTKLSRIDKTGQNLAFSISKGAPAWNKYTTAGGSD